MRCSKLSILGLFLSVCILHSCLGTNPKTLGKKTATDTSNFDADTFAITLAYRNTVAPSTGRVVQLQGVRNVASANMVNTCGSTGASCTCDFYTSATDTNPISAVSVGISKDNNSFSCNINPVLNPASYVKVRLRTSDGKKTTGLIDIKTTLTLQDVIGDLSTAKVNKIYKYSCARSFFEGEGVTTSQINCVANQKLGLISATYDYYLYSNTTTNNTSQKFTASFWSAVCQRPEAEFARSSCGNSTPDLRYGLYSEAVAPFVVQIKMTRAPEGTDLTIPYGYATLPDSAGNCPTGLVPVRPWLAQPPSITYGSIDGINPPSNFLNTGEGVLNNTVIEVDQPSPFVVTRQKNVTTCAAGGSCALATFDGATQLSPTTAYTALTPVVCAIPKSLLTGI